MSIPNDYRIAYPGQGSWLFLTAASGLGLGCRITKSQHWQRVRDQTHPPYPTSTKLIRGFLPGGAVAAVVQLVQARINALLPDQLFVGAVLAHLAVVQYQDLVGVADGR